jgi:hypothetical protein
VATKNSPPACAGNMKNCAEPQLKPDPFDFILCYGHFMTDDEHKQSKARKRAAIQRFCELDRAGLISLDWSEAGKTGRVKIRYKLYDVNAFPELSKT